MKTRSGISTYKNNISLNIGLIKFPNCSVTINTIQELEYV